MPLIGWAVAHFVFGLSGVPLLGAVVMGALPTTQNVFLFPASSRCPRNWSRTSSSPAGCSACRLSWLRNAPGLRGPGYARSPSKGGGRGPNDGGVCPHHDGVYEVRQAGHCHSLQSGQHFDHCVVLFPGSTEEGDGIGLKTGCEP